MGILVRTTGAVMFQSSGKVLCPELVSFLAIFRTRFLLNWESFHRKFRTKEIRSNSRRITAGASGSFQRLSQKHKKPPHLGGEVIILELESAGSGKITFGKIHLSSISYQYGTAFLREVVTISRSRKIDR